MNQLFISLLSINPVKMRVPEKRSDDEALLSLDFIIGFTIFMVALIFVSVMISGLLVHLQSRTIDYDAVAYRTSVVLVEDPGEPSNWQQANLMIPAERDGVKRLGLAVNKYYPGILKQSKVDKFFNNSPSSGCSATDRFCDPEDYRDKLIFGDYPYNFNISLRKLDNTSNISVVGSPVQNNTNFGYMKRIVKIQEPGSVDTINALNTSDGGNQTTITVRIDFSELYTLPAPYQIDPLNDEMKIIIQNFSADSFTANLTGFQVCKYPLIGLPGCVGENSYDNSPDMIVKVDGNSSNTEKIQDNVTVTFEPGFFSRVGYDAFSSVDTIFSFDRNVTNQSIYYYNYTANLTVQPLEPAVLEVRVW
jgi:hypothetical protein